MKHILITGDNSYIGNSFKNYLLNNFPDNYTVDVLDMVDNSWRDKDFSCYDSIVDVVGIAHRKETKENAHLYFEINRDLAIETAKKAKSDGVGQFVFISSMSVYGMNSGVITKETVPDPKSNYGRSKLEAEEGIIKLRSDDFKCCFVRPPMVYGNGCKGNFQTIVKLVKKLPFFPWVKNQRSMIYIDNLAAFLKLCIDQELEGVYMPQNKEYVQTSEMASIIASTLGKKIIICRGLGFIICCMRPFFGILKKAFGSIIYENTEDFDFVYNIVEQKESIERSVK